MLPASDGLARDGSDCYDNVMSWDGMPIGEPDF